MALYTARQLLLLFALLGAAAVGLAIREWRATYPELADRLEGVDRRPETNTGRSVDRRTDPEHTLPAADPGPVDLNSATPDDLARLPGVGPSLAARIVERRQSGGTFRSIEDLRRVKGIGSVKLERLRHLVTIVE
ncbi:MAG TPA: helix-hairpin-helix domain-containing protein [Methylomirabilota bacterium]|nr:helix-hairpin-helix domain-containing protein [Methylomirabilota bacterium]